MTELRDSARGRGAQIARRLLRHDDANLDPAGVPVPGRPLHVHARDGGRAGHLPRRLVDDRGAVRRLGKRAHARLLRRVLHRVDARPEHEHRFTPYGWEWRIREGELSGQLLRPLHPIHHDLAWFAGWKVVVIVLWLPIAVALSLLFDPTFDVRPIEIVVFAIAIWGAYLIRSFNQSALGMITFWTTRVGAIFQLYIMFELLLSGRLVRLQLMPNWVETLAWFLPFRWTFFFPIQALVGDLSDQELLVGLAMQVLWICVGILICSLAWWKAIRQYSAVAG